MVLYQLAATRNVITNTDLRFFAIAVEVHGRRARLRASYERGRNPQTSLELSAIEMAEILAESLKAVLLASGSRVVS
jgi:hypothetical protein